MLFFLVTFLFILLFLATSVTTFLNPHFIWNITESWKAVRQPSKAYFIYLRIGGFIGTIVGLLFLAALFGSFS